MPAGTSRLEVVLQGLVGRGLMSKAPAINAGDPRRSDGQRIYEDDWWDVTPVGRAAMRHRAVRAAAPAAPESKSMC